MLQVSIRRKCKTIGGLSLGIQFYQIAGNVFNPLLGFAFKLIPGIGTQFVKPGNCAFLTNIF